MSHSSKPVTLIVVASMLAVLAAPAYARQGLDLRSPDARDGAATYQQPAAVDLRSPDAQDSAHANVAAQPAPSAASSDDNGWVLPAIGIAAALSLALGLTVVTTRRRRDRQAGPTVSA